MKVIGMLFIYHLTVNKGWWCFVCTFTFRKCTFTKKSPDSSSAKDSVTRRSKIITDYRSSHRGPIPPVNIFPIGFLQRHLFDMAFSENLMDEPVFVVSSQSLAAVLLVVGNGCYAVHLVTRAKY